MAQSSLALTLGNIAVRQLDGLFSLNDLHKAAGGEPKHEPNQFTRLDQTKALIAELKSADSRNYIETRRGANGGTYACRELVIAYAAWISAGFHLKVIRVFLGSAQPVQVDHPALDYTRISPAQAQHLKELVQLVAESGKQTHGETWARLHRKMKVNSYLELSASRFDEACQYLSSKMDDTSMAVLIQKHFPRADQALQAPSLINRRWLVSLDRAGREIVQPIDQDAYVGTLDQLTTGITDPGVLFTTAELLALGTACAQRLASRRSPELLTLAQATTTAAFAATQAQWSQQPLIAHG